ncbi:MAG: CPBP family intramembrane metalloprotease [Planctomycetes bacterium]|nr:CPBP family intramembrane metalloprotease [Planctomycetota bacterium]
MALAGGLARRNALASSPPARADEELSRARALAAELAQGPGRWAIPAAGVALSLALLITAGRLFRPPPRGESSPMAWDEIASVVLVHQGCFHWAVAGSIALWGGAGGGLERHHFGAVVLANLAACVWLLARNGPGAAGLGLQGAVRSSLVGGLHYALFLPVLGAVALVNLAGLDALGVEVTRQQAVVAIEGERDPALVATFVLAAGVVAPFAEEVFFRGALYPALRRRLGVAAAVTVDAAAFALVHQAPSQAVPLFAIGVVLAVLRERSGGIVAPVVFHAAHNALNLAVALLHAQAG